MKRFFQRATYQALLKRISGIRNFNLRSIQDLSLYAKLLIPGIVLLLFLLISFSISFQFFKHERNIARNLLVVQKNIVLLEEINRLAQEIEKNGSRVKNDLEKLINTCHKSLLALQEGGKVPGLKGQRVVPLEKPSYKKSLEKTILTWDDYRKTLYTAISEPPKVMKKNGFAGKTGERPYVMAPNPVFRASVIQLNELYPDLALASRTLEEKITRIGHQKEKKDKAWLIISLIINVSLLVTLIALSLLLILRPIYRVKSKIHLLEKGDIKQDFSIGRDDEIGQIYHSLGGLQARLNNITEFILKVSEGHLNKDIDLAGKRDYLGIALLKMLNSFKQTEEKKKEREKADKQTNWATTGQAKFADILRNNNLALSELGYDIISKLVEYVGANQGGLFILREPEEEDESQERYLDLIASQAYNRRKYISKKIEPGEGLVGTCFLEGETIHLAEIPEEYINITSGLGGANPRELLLVPLKHDEVTLGILEMASFEKFEKYQIQFVEELAEDIASTISISKINEQTNKLLKRSQQQAEELASQEEEMRQNLEEMQATQEESGKRAVELHDLVEAVNHCASTYELNTDGKFINANEKYIETLSMKKNQLVGKSHYKMVGESFTGLSSYDEFWSQINKGIITNIEIEYVVSGNRIWLYETYTPIHDINQQISKILVIAFNISESKEKQKQLKQTLEKIQQKEEELHVKIEELNVTREELEEEHERQIEESERLHDEIQVREIHRDKLFETVDEALIELDESGQIKRINQEVINITGFDVEKLIAKPIWDLIPDLPKELAGELPSMTIPVEMKMLHAEGESLPVKIKATDHDTLEGKLFILFIKHDKKILDLKNQLAKLGEEKQKIENQLQEEIERLKSEQQNIREEVVEHLTGEPESGFIVWYNKYNIQIPEMDDQHKRLVKLINEFKEAVDQQKGNKELLKLVKNLINYSSYHFQAEERYFTDYKYKGKTAHEKEHQDLNKHLIGIQKQIQGGNIEKAIGLLARFKESLLAHFTGSDVRYVELFRAHGH